MMKIYFQSIDFQVMYRAPIKRKQEMATLMCSYKIGLFLNSFRSVTVYISRQFFFSLKSVL